MSEALAFPATEPVATPAAGLAASVAAPHDLAPATVGEMFALFSLYYRDVSRDRFTQDLAGKHYVVLLEDAAGRLRGFSTLAVSAGTDHDRPIRVVFSGDTIIDRPFWGSPAFAAAWVRLIGRIHAEAPDLPLFWLLIVKGHRTFRYLPAFAKTFVPHWEPGDRTGLLRLREAIAGEMFGALYDPATGLVRFAEPRGRLATKWSAPSPREAARPDVAFFLQSNPGHAAGDELVCLCELSENNMRPMTLRLFREGRDAWTAGAR